MSEEKITKSLEYIKNLKLGDAIYNSKIQRLYLQILESKKLIIEIESFADAYSFDQFTPENGFRSIIEIYFIAIAQALEACDKPKGIRKFFMTRSRQINDIQNFCGIVDNFLKMFYALLEFHKNSKVKGSLIAEEGESDNIVAKTYKDINLLSFYNQNIGFHHETPTSLQSRQFSLIITLFADYYYSGKNLMVRILSIPMSAIKYFFNDHARALKHEDVIRNADIEFLRFASLFFVSKLSCYIQNIFSYRLKVNKEIKIAPEPLQILSSKYSGLNGLNVSVPQIHIGVRPILCQLYSAKTRQGMVGEKSSVEPSKTLIIHVHGGGFYTNSPQSHEVYLRDWVVKLDVPILAIKYSLAPKAPFPRALEEIFYVYCWVLKHGNLLGTTAENIILVGDSAGANLITALTIKCIESGVRLPQGLLSIYGLFLSNYSAIPSMMMGFVDMNLNYNHILRIFKSYAGHHKHLKFQRNGQIPKAPVNEFCDKIPKNHHMSPILAPDDIIKQFPKMILLTTTLDLCLDENVEFAKKLRRNGVDVKLDVIHGLIHGFNHLVKVCSKSYNASMTCAQHLQDLINHHT
ncbi:hypothetical protein ACKWTF_000749 [Chironomus riparius]